MAGLAQQCDRAYHAIGGEPAWPAPPAAPIAITLLTRSQNLNTQLSVINPEVVKESRVCRAGLIPASAIRRESIPPYTNDIHKLSLESQLRAARQTIKPFIEDAREDMIKVDQATDHTERMKKSYRRHLAGMGRRQGQAIAGKMPALRRMYGISSQALDPKKTSPAPGGSGGAGGIDQVVIRATKDGTYPESIWVDWEAVEGAVYEIQWYTDAALTQMIGSATVTASELEVQGLQQGQQYWFRVRAVRASNAGPWSDQATRVANI